MNFCVFLFATTKVTPNISNRLLPKFRQSDGKIIGQVLENKKPVARRVFCYHRRTGELVATTKSGDDGFYQIENLVKGMIYYLVSIDEENDGKQYKLTGKDLVIAQ